MSSPFFIIVKGKVVDVHCCVFCLARIPEEGICAECAKFVHAANQVLKVSVPIKRLINPEDLR